MPKQTTTDSLPGRILAAGSSLVALRCDDVSALGEHLRLLAVHSGCELYLWRTGDGLSRLRERDEAVPDCATFAQTLRFFGQAPSPGVFFMLDPPRMWSPELLAMLQAIAQIDPAESRRLVLRASRTDLPDGLPALTELTWDETQATRPRLRDGKWVW